MKCTKCNHDNTEGSKFCSECATRLIANINSYNIKFNNKAPTNPAAIFALVVVIVAGIFIYNHYSSLNRQDKETYATNAYTTKNTHKVIYKVNGTASEISLTYQNQSGGTSQTTGFIPWDETLYSMENGEFLYVSAQNQKDSGSVTCEIWVDGKLFKTSTSSGAYVIASCSGTLDIN